MIYFDTKKKYSYLFVLSACYASLSGVLMFIADSLLGIAVYGAWVYMILWLIFAVWTMKADINDRRAKCYLKTLFAYTLFLIAMYALFPNTRQYFAEYRNDLLFALSFGLLAYAIIKNEENIHQLILDGMPIYRFSIILLSLSLLFGSAKYFGFMGLGLRIAPVWVLFYYSMRYTKATALDKIVFFVGLVVSLFANRQTFLILMAGVAVTWTFCNRRTDKTILRFAVLMSIAIVGSLFYDSILQIIANIVNALGINGKGITSLIDGSLLDGSNRSSIYEHCISTIRNNGPKVSGLFADRYYLRQYRGNIAYAHNFILELLIDFGVVIGGILIAAFLILCVYKVIKSKNKALLVVLFLAFFARLFVSNSIVSSQAWWVFLGALLNKNAMNVSDLVPMKENQTDARNSAAGK